MSAGRAYSYRALRSDGSVARGRLDATTAPSALAALDRMGLMALDVTPLSSARDRRGDIPVADLAIGLRMLAELLEAGLPLARALHALTELAPPSWRPTLVHLRESVREGKSLGASLREAPARIPALVSGMASAGEMAGNLAAAVRRAADVTESAAETRAAVRNALAYPALLAVAGTGAIALMVGVVIPRFAAILGDLSQTLPPTTQFVLAAADVARGAAFPALAGMAVTTLALRVLSGTHDGRRRLHAFLLQLPLVGSIRRASATSRTAHALATLLDTGVPLRQAMAYAADASGDACVNAAVRSAAQRVEAGQGIAGAMRECGALTPLALRLTQAGEESGRLSAMLRHAAKLEQERGDRLGRAAVRLLEPVLILVFAGGVALVAAALLQAVYAVRPAA